MILFEKSRKCKAEADRINPFYVLFRVNLDEFQTISSSEHL